MRSTIERSSSWPAAPTIIQPKPGQPTSVMQRPQEALASAPSFDRDIDVDPVRFRHRCPGIGCATVRRWWSCASAAPRCPGTAAPSAKPARSHRAAPARPRRRPASPCCQVQQHERRAVIDDVGVGACDEVRPRRAVEQRLLGGDLNLVRQVTRKAPSASACDGVRSSINAPSATTPATMTRSAVPCDHHAGRAVLHQRAVGARRSAWSAARRPW